jgi:hypothetical protein
LEVGRQEEKEVTRVFLFNQNDTHFASFDMPELPRVNDVIEIGFPKEQTVKSFIVERIVHRMVYDERLDFSREEPPWHWELRVYGELQEFEIEAPCICAPGITKCPKHGNQPAARDTCPLCEKAVLGYCAQGVYCTSEQCKYVS